MTLNPVKYNDITMATVAVWSTTCCSVWLLLRMCVCVCVYVCMCV